MGKALGRPIWPHGRLSFLNTYSYHDINLLNAIEALTIKKRAWLVNWKCFGSESTTNLRMDKLLNVAPRAIRKHIERSRNGYRWLDSPTTTKKKRRKTKQSK